MEKQDLLFFCTLCRDKPSEEIEKLQCNIPHTVKIYKRDEYIAYQGDRVTRLAMLIHGKGEIIDFGAMELERDTKRPTGFFWIDFFHFATSHIDYKYLNKQSYLFFN